MRTKYITETVEMVSYYGILRPIKIQRDIEFAEVSYRQAVKAASNNSGDYYIGLVIDRANKRAWLNN
jgi:hypothetical protein